MVPVICTFLVMADVHGSPSTAWALASSIDPAPETWVAHLGDFVDYPAQWWYWDQYFGDLDVVGAIGNHDDPEGFLERFRPSYRSVCGDPPEFVAFTVDSRWESRSPRANDAYAWAKREHPDTPWVVLSHRPVAPCSTRYEGHEASWRRRLEAVLPAGSIVISGHEHVFCIHRGFGYTQIIASTGGGKRYECATLNAESMCEEMPEHPTYLRVSPLLDEVEQVVVTPEGEGRRLWSIIGGPEE